MNFTNNDSTFNSTININNTSTSTNTETSTTTYSMIVDIEIINYEDISEYLSFYLLCKKIRHHPTIPSIDERVKVLIKNKFANFPDIIQEKLERKVKFFINQTGNQRLKPSQKELIRIWKLFVTKKMNIYFKNILSSSSTLRPESVEALSREGGNDLTPDMD